MKAYQITSLDYSEVPSRYEARTQASQANDIKFQRSDAGVFKLPAVTAAHRALSDLRRYKAKSPNALPESFEMAEAFLGLVAPDIAGMKAYGQIFASGTAVVSFQAFDRSAQFEFLENGEIAVNIDIADEEMDLDVHGFDGVHLPEVIAANFFMR